MLESSDIFEPVKIVVAEDDSFTRKLLESMFKSLGFSVRFAYDGAEGLEAFKEDMPDLVLSDYNMPKMNGLEMFKEIKKIKPDVRFVLMTIYTDSDVLIDAINLGVHRFLDKPVYKSKLEEVLNHLVNEINISKDLVRHQHLLKAYRLGVDASTVFSLLDSRGNFTYVNSNFCDLSGYPEEELIGQHYSVVRKNRDVSEINFRTVSKYSKEMIWQGFATNLSKSGNEYITELSLLPVFNKGDISGYISIEKDMSFMVANHIKQLQQFFDADSSILFAYEQPMKLATANSAFLDFFGYGSLQEAAERNFCLIDFAAKDSSFSQDAEMICKGNLKALRKNADAEGNTSVVKIALINPVNEKEYTFTVDIFRLDQSYLGLKDIEIIRLNDITELEELRKDEITRTMLASIGKLSAGITHEINTPLTYIKGNTELLEGEVQDNLPSGTFEEMKDFFSSIYDGIERIGLIIQSMKEVTGEITFEMEKINIYSTIVVAGRMVHNRAKHVAPIYLNNSILNLESDANEEYFEIEGAAKMLEQLWIILMNNSLDQLTQSDFPFEKKYINITVKHVDNGKVLVTLKDNGGGIDPKIMNKLFDLFSSTKKHKGMGIGLNIAKSIVDKHNGTIKPYNSDEGAVFEILL